MRSNVVYPVLVYNRVRFREPEGELLDISIGMKLWEEGDVNKILVEDWDHYAKITLFTDKGSRIIFRATTYSARAITFEAHNLKRAED